ncbi:MAG: phosphoribosyl-AMP cyclohydrolase [Phycisphaerae bacterium]|nr:phosphoribosyl-AMP cyclohydrolase [Phycisphaerae bacterium]
MNDSNHETGSALTIRYNDDGLVPAIVQDADGGEILMMAWMNREAFEHTMETGRATFFSRSRNKLWVKGESSGHVQQVESCRVDCDQDTVLLRVRSSGPACHVGYRSCFYREVQAGDRSLKFVAEKVFDPDKVYKA